MWGEWLHYWMTNGTDKDWSGKSDFWGEYQDGFPEWNPSPFGEEQMIIYEPCNYASNLAYLRSATRTCSYQDWSFDVNIRRGLKRSFFMHHMGSAWMHGSHTHLGGDLDTRLISVISYLAY